MAVLAMCEVVTAYDFSKWCSKDELGPTCEQESLWGTAFQGIRIYVFNLKMFLKYRTRHWCYKDVFWIGTAGKERNMGPMARKFL